MRLTIFAAALLVGTAAIAQSNDPGMSPPDATAAPALVAIQAGRQEQDDEPSED